MSATYDDYENGKLDGYNEGYADGLADGKTACEEERARMDEKKALDERLVKIEDTLALILSLWVGPNEVSPRGKPGRAGQRQ